MESIYADAARVLVWLDPRPDVQNQTREDSNLFFTDVTVMIGLIKARLFLPALDTTGDCLSL
jgi:hypothetical protein